MKKSHSDKVTAEGRRTSTKSKGVDPTGAKAIVTDRMIDVLEHEEGPEQSVGGGPSFAEVEARRTPSPASNVSSGNSAGMQEMHETLERTVRTYESARSGHMHTGLFSSAVRPLSETGSSAPVNYGGSSQNWQQIKFVTKLIPPFAGRDEDNVVRWLERIGSVARVYGIPDGSLVLAAVGQLTDRALRWYNRQSIESLSTWDEFKFQIRRHFERRELVTTILERVKNRVWRARSERFAVYAEDKLQLMQGLVLTEKEKIAMLADGVRDVSLRRMLLDTWLEAVPDFIEHVRRITEDDVLQKQGSSDDGRSGVSVRPVEPSAKTCFTCKRLGHLTRDCRAAKTTCFKCGQQGHISPKCPRRNTAPGSSLNLVKQASTSSTGYSTEEVTSVNEIKNIETLSGACVIVRRHGCVDGYCQALVDTGSPVSLIKRSAYKKFCDGGRMLAVSGAM